MLDWEIKDEDGVTGSKVKTEVKIFSGALDEDAEITISLMNPAYAMVSIDQHRSGVRGAWPFSI